MKFSAVGPLSRLDPRGSARMPRRSRLLATAAALSLLTGAPDAATAQRPAPPADTAAVDTSAVVPLPPLVIHALRTPLLTRDAPFAVSVRDLEREVPSAGLSLDDRLRAVPGLQIDDRHNDALGDRIAIRGFGARAQFGVRGVQILVDGIPATMPDGQATLNHLDISALAGAEVVRGPAAVAHGNAAGGVILLRTLAPPAAPFRQEATVTAGSDGLLRLRSTTGGGDGRRGWLVALSRETSDGFREHAEAMNLNLTGRADLPLAGGRLRAVAHGVSYDALNPGSLTPEQFATDPDLAQPFNVAQRTGEEGRHGQVGLSWQRDLGPVRLDAAVHAIGRSLENPIPPTIIELDRRAGGLHLMLASDADAGRLAWTVGLDAGLQRDDRQNFENDGGQPGALTLDQQERVVDAAAFAQLLLPLGQRVRLFAGARYDRIRFSATDRLTGPDDPDDSGERTMDALSPSAGISVLPLEGVTLFANVSTAFQTPTTTELVNRPDGAGGFNPALEPQRAVSVEAGARARWGARGEVELTAYRARIRDALVPFEVASAPGRQYFRNAGGALHRGVEAAAQLRLDDVALRASYTRTDARFTAYETADGVYDGLRVPGVRPWMVDAALTVSPVDELELVVQQRWTGDLPVDDANETFAPGYRLTGIRAGLAPVRLGPLVAEPYGGVDNLGGTRYVASVVPNAFGGRYLEPGPDRTFYIGVRASFATR